MVDGDVVGDLEQPAREFELGPVAIDVVEDLHEGVLREVFGGLVVAHHPIDEREHRALVASDQLAIRRLAPFLRERDDVRIGEVAGRELETSRGQESGVRDQGVSGPRCRGARAVPLT